jgi:hypothetical protein
MLASTLQQLPTQWLVLLNSQRMLKLKQAQMRPVLSLLLDFSQNFQIPLLSLVPQALLPAPLSKQRTTWQLLQSPRLP